MRGQPGWERLDPVKRQALTVIADKVARILSGDPEYADNWHDIAGYARLAEQRLTLPGLGGTQRSYDETDVMPRNGGAA